MRRIADVSGGVIGTNILFGGNFNARTRVKKNFIDNLGDRQGDKR